MAKPATIKIDDVEYVRKDFVGSCDGPIKIAVLDRGFVYVGHVTMEGDFIVLSDARNIRKWGTSKGLGELREGPLTNTVLDFYGTVRVPLRALISFIDVEQSKWKLS